MSGGVGPTCGGGITLPSSGLPPPPLHPTPTSSTLHPHHHYYLFSIKPLSDIAFAVLMLPYLLLLSALAFP